MLFAFNVQRGPCQSSSVQESYWMNGRGTPGPVDAFFL